MARGPRLVDEVNQLPEVSQAVGLGRGNAAIDGDTKELTVAEPAALDAVLDLDVSAGSLVDLGTDGLAVSDATADSNGWQLGDVVIVTFSDGQIEDLTVAATYEAADIAGDYVMPAAVYEPHTLQEVDALVIVDVADGTSLPRAQDAVEQVAAGYGTPDVLDRDAFAADVSSGVDMMLTIIYALLVLAIVIALMGIANTLSIHARTRELSLLRAVGQTRSQVRSMVRWESVLVATLGAVGGIAVGVFLGWALVEAAGADAGSAISQFALPVGRLAIIVIVGAIAGVLAGIRPARRAARLDVRQSIAAE